MRKSTLLKMALASAAMFIFVGAFAQTNTGQWGTTATVGKYTQSAAAPIDDYTTVDYTVKYITTGKTMPFFVWPSAAYNPNWNPANAAFVNPNFPTQTELQNNVLSTFVWQSGANYAGLSVVAGYTKNYVELTAGAAGSTTLIEVTETSPSVSCAADPVYFGFTAIAAPTVTITNATSSIFGLTNVIASACDGAAALTTAITATLAPAQESNWYINMPYTVYNVAALDGSGNIVLPGTDITGSSTVDVFGADGTNVPSATNPLIATASPIVASQTYGVQNNMITVYRFTYNNVNANISRISDYLDRRASTLTGTYGFSYYPAAPAGTNYYIIALPVPVTGPIYHIANNFAY